jgi:flavin reductase (DIM6/NTAB) family NADH-FMN oxidoreductase RutF
MTIHSEHPFLDPDPDPVRRLRARLGGAVSLWTSGDADERAGLTVSSVMVATGEPGAVVGLLDPDSELHELLVASRAAVVHLLQWGDRDLADAFAGVAPAPGGAFRLGSWEQTAWGPRLATAATWAGVRLVESRPLGWRSLVVCEIETVVVGVDDDPLVHRRGRYLRH